MTYSDRNNNARRSDNRHTPNRKPRPARPPVRSGIDPDTVLLRCVGHTIHIRLASSDKEITGTLLGYNQYFLIVTYDNRINVLSKGDISMYQAPLWTVQEEIRAKGNAATEA